jgi:hypothetical protein
VPRRHGKVAGKIVRAANSKGRDVAAAAARLQPPLTDHATVDQRVTAAVTRINAGLNTSSAAARSTAWCGDNRFEALTLGSLNTLLAARAVPRPKLRAASAA